MFLAKSAIGEIMNDMRIAKSTGEIDKRTINGNNGTRRGKDKDTRKPRHGYLVLKDEVKAGLRARLEEVVLAYGGISNLAKAIGMRYGTIRGWFDRGRISVEGASLIQLDYRRNGFKGFRASYCRPDIKFDSNGKPLEKRCSNRKLMRFVTKAEAEARGMVVSPDHNYLRSLLPEEREKEKARRKAEREAKRAERKRKKVVVSIDSTDC